MYKVSFTYNLNTLIVQDFIEIFNLLDVVNMRKER